MGFDGQKIVLAWLERSGGSGKLSEFPISLSQADLADMIRNGWLEEVTSREAGSEPVYFLTEQGRRMSEGD